MSSRTEVSNERNQRLRSLGPDGNGRMIMIMILAIGVTMTLGGILGCEDR